MKKLKYYFKRIFSMNYKKGFETIGKIHKRSGKSRIYDTLFYKISCRLYRLFFI